ncbi:alpha-ketoglutarate-dependent dioxygenase alkB homolog 7, mitochondrial [Halyomorpha halys]|uniref:alpha-ketoglutarate-dependent dioxygenase alkB homolog 7, mitochondrial n=1 Tax=Halyomorpha halys TaxID=286706 RepID=UPI0006D5278E|nr:alpha-ketoglutarate-dependent dioxygenase alkB homolog 7, mitochondrial [Halyomorpha halys]
MYLVKSRAVGLVNYNVFIPYYHSSTWLDLTSCFSTKNEPEVKGDEIFEFITEPAESNKKLAMENVSVINDFLSQSEEKSLLKEIEPYMKRLRYQYDHWDHAIHGFRETERLKWNESNSAILNKIKCIAFGNDSTLPHTHILDLAENGYIKPHIDSIRFCGNTIAGASLLSDSVMRFCNEQNKFTFSVLLKRRSLYIMRGPVRYDFTHEILSNDVSCFQGNKIIKTRRISVICRSRPEPTNEENEP